MKYLPDIRAATPWQLKIASKLVLSRLPANYGVWRKLSLFRHGKMDQPEYAYRVFRLHHDRCDFGAKERASGFVALELGPGDSLFSCLAAHAFGARTMWLVDVGDFAKDDQEAYQRMAECVRAHGHPVPTPRGTRDSILRMFNATYATQGLASLAQIPSQSVDFIYSHAVLEHLRKADFAPMMRELRRIIKPDGMCSHRVDLRDHLAEALNNLRFDESVWEAEWMAKSGFYTNRIQFETMCKMFGEAGFDVDVLDVQRWPDLPTPKDRMSEPFRSMSEEVLLVRGFDVRLRPR